MQIHTQNSKTGSLTTLGMAIAIVFAIISLPVVLVLGLYTTATAVLNFLTSWIKVKCP